MPLPVITAGPTAWRPTTRHTFPSACELRPLPSSHFISFSTAPTCLWLPHLHDALPYLCLSLHRLCLGLSGLPTVPNLADLFLQVQRRRLSSRTRAPGPRSGQTSVCTPPTFSVALKRPMCLSVCAGRPGALQSDGPRLPTGLYARFPTPVRAAPPKHPHRYVSLTRDSFSPLLGRSPRARRA